jgi:uncharacterized protein YecE (DUF72 family)
MRAVRIGCSGWSYPHWRGVFYPEGLAQRRWLEYYATRLATVEVNATFYRLPRRDTVAGWVESAPEAFVFAVKASRYLTHVRRLREVGPGLERFFGSIGPLVASSKLGPILWQLPESFRRDDDRLARVLDRLPPGRHAFEFRHPSWFEPDVYALLRGRRAALVIGDHPERPFQAHELTTDWTYIRLHYGSRGRRGNYSGRELEEWAQRIRAWRRRADVFAYFNNDWEGFAVANAEELGRLL